VKARCVSIVLFAIFVSACGPGIYLRTDYERTADFARYRTFAVKQGNPSGNPTVDRRIVAAIEQALQAKGYRIVPESAADALVIEHAATHEKHDYVVFDDGWIGWGWRRGWGAPIEEYNVDVGTLVADIFDASTKQPIWHGSVSGLVSGVPDKDAKDLQTAVDRLFERFPPRLKALSAVVDLLPRTARALGPADE